MKTSPFNLRIVLATLGFSLLAFISFSQELNEEIALDSKASGWNPNALYVQFGGVEGGRYTTDFNLIKQFIDIRNMPGVQENDFYNMGYYSIGMGSGVQLMISHPTRKKQVGRVAFDWRYGLFAGEQQIAYAQFNEQNTFAFDTLTSAATGQEFIVDSVSARDWNVSVHNMMIGLKTEYIGRVLTKRRAEFYLGVGVSAGILTNAVTEYNYTESYFTEMRGGGNFNEYDGEEKENIHYSFRQSNGNGWLTSLNVPAGVSVNLGKKREFWKKLYLNWELAPSVTMLGTPEGGVIVSSGFNFVSGLRINL
jgi:hypothetical protein